MSAGPEAAKKSEAPPLRILFVTLEYPPAICGGAERQARLQAEELTRRGHRVTVVCPRLSNLPSGTENGVDVRRLPFIDAGSVVKRVSYGLSLLVFLARRIREFEVIHAHGTIPQVELVALLAAFSHRPLYMKLATGGKTGDVTKMGSYAWLTRRFSLRQARVLQALSEEIRQELLGVGVPAAKIARIANAVDTDIYAPPDRAGGKGQRRRLGLPLDGMIVLFAGRFAAVKGIDTLLDAWRRITVRDRDMLLLVGTYDTGGAIPPIAEEDGVQVRGWSENIVDYYHSADVFVQPSRGEGMSNALLEAMACGLPVIATRVGAAEAMIDDGENGLLVEPDDSEGMARALEQLLGDSGLRQRLGANARTTASQYSVKAVVDAIDEQYQSIAGRRR